MRPHPFDAISAALGIVAVALGALVAADSIDGLDSGGAWWLAVGVLVIGLGLIPWSTRRTAGPAPADETVGAPGPAEDEELFGDPVAGSSNPEDDG